MQVVTITYYDEDNTKQNGAVALNNVPRYITPINYKQIGEQRWKLVSDFIIYLGGTAVVRIPKDYEWDGASVPAFVHWYEEPDDHLEASLIHDHAYQYHWLLMWQDGSWLPIKITKSKADMYFRIILDDILGVRMSKAWVLWDAVHISGWFAWFTETCNYQCKECPCNSGGWCPYVNKLLIKLHLTEVHKNAPKSRREVKE